MSFTFPCDVQLLARERTPQFMHLGVKRELLEIVRPLLQDLWRDAPGGWVYEWSRAAEIAEQEGEDFQASILYGVARFPCLGNDPHVRAHSRQLSAYLRAMAKPDKAYEFERLTPSIPYRDGTTEVPIHMLRFLDLPADAPLLLFMGGVDTWKMDVHRAAVDFASRIQAHVALVDMPGTGESKVALAPDAEVILKGALDAVKRPGQRVGCIAFSFSGLWAAKLALQGKLDAAVAIGATIDATFSRENQDRMPNGMDTIIANAMGYAERPSREVLRAALAEFSLRRQGLLDAWTSSTPLYVVNGDADPYVPPSDVTLFSERPATVARLVGGATHCAPEAMRSLVPELSAWLHHHLH